MTARQRNEKGHFVKAEPDKGPGTKTAPTWEDEESISLKIGGKSVDYERNGAGGYTLRSYTNENPDQDFVFLLVHEDTQTGDRVKWPAGTEVPEIERYPE